MTDKDNKPALAIWSWDGFFKQGWYASIKRNGEYQFTIQRSHETTDDEATKIVLAVVAGLNWGETA